MQDIAKNNIITISSGDSFIAPLVLRSGDDSYAEQYVLTEDDTIYFAIMKPRQPFEAGIIRKVYTIDNLDKNNNVLISINGSETERLAPGTYYYEIKFKTVKKNVEYVETVVSRTKFYVI